MTYKKKIIELKNVWKTYYMGDISLDVLKGVNVEIEEGEFVVIVGPSGSGKCVTGDTLIVSEDGELIPICEIRKQKVFALNKMGEMKSFKYSKFHQRRVSSILELETTSGKKIKCTPEHPLFTITENGFSEIKAKDSLNEFVATPRIISFKGKPQQLDSFSKLKADKTLVIHNSSNLVKGLFKKLKVSRKEICKKFKIKPNTYDYWLQGNNIKLFNLVRILSHYPKIINILNNSKLTALNSNIAVKIPLKTNPDLLELFGFLVGDGNSDKTGIVVTNIEEVLKNKVIFLTKKVFGIDAKKYQKKVICNSTVIKSFFHYVFGLPLRKKSRNIRVPDFLLKCNLKEIAAFIRGLFDCDGFVAKNQKEISITLASKELILQLRHLLMRFGIHSRYSEVIKYASNTVKKTKRIYYKLNISGLNNLKIYHSHIGFNSNFKMSRLEKHIKGKGDTNVDIIPCGKLIKKIRKSSSVKLTREEHKLLWGCENGRFNPSIKKVNQIIGLFDRRNINCARLKQIVKMQIFWDKVISIKKIKKNIQVYDLTVPGADNFVANDFIIHNSTMMNQVGILDMPTKGKVYYRDRDLTQLTESDLAQLRGKRIGFVFQQFNLINTLTALENVTLPTIFQNIDEETRVNRAKSLLTQVGLGDRMEHRPNELSGGQQQRVAIARALINNPEVILADEPTGNLDSKSGHQVMEMLTGFHKKEGKTIILVTHDVDLVKYSEKTIYLKDGEVVKIKKGDHKPKENGAKKK